MIKIYTKTGDNGQSSLLGGKRVQKSCLEMEVIGEIDELNASVGLIITKILDEKRFKETKRQLLKTQHNLFVIGSNLAAVQTELVEIPKLKNIDIKKLEDWIDKMEENLTPLSNFILPGGTEIATRSYLTRTVCRRVERKLIDMTTRYQLDPLIQQYLNRLSDYLFVLARWFNKIEGNIETKWQK